MTVTDSDHRARQLARRTAVAFLVAFGVLASVNTYYDQASDALTWAVCAFLVLVALVVMGRIHEYAGRGAGA